MMGAKEAQRMQFGEKPAGWVVARVGDGGDRYRPPPF